MLSYLQILLLSTVDKVNLNHLIINRTMMDRTHKAINFWQRSPNNLGELYTRRNCSGFATVGGFRAISK
eukprot:scaffold224_cov276-Chaetoceros_neogracile.AAC.21